MLSQLMPFHPTASASASDTFSSLLVRYGIDRARLDRSIAGAKPAKAAYEYPSSDLYDVTTYSTYVRSGKLQADTSRRKLGKRA